MTDDMNHNENPASALAEAARSLVAANGEGVLCTLRAEDGYPYGSLVDYLPLDDGDALLLLSRLAEHRRYLAADPRASLLIAPAAGGARLAEARLTLLGRVEPTADADRARQRDAYLRRHPQAQVYIDFRDFDFFRLRVESARYIAGFGRMGWLSQPHYRDAAPDPLAGIAADAVAHMNDDHADALCDYARAFAGVEPSACRMTALDRRGFELLCQTGQGPTRLRLAFDRPLNDPSELRPALIELAARARGRADD